MKNLICILFITGLINNSLLAEVDPFNTYQYHEAKKAGRPWFEWWYYKVVLPDSGESFYFVYGVVNPWDADLKLPASRAYVGMGDFSQKYQMEEKSSPKQFMAAYDQTFIKIGNNQATDSDFSGDIQNETGENSSWNISIRKDWAFNATSWATGKNITNIEWYPAQAGAHCSGSIISKGKLIQFTDAPCYQDRNWGSEFPLWWTWIVSNHFDQHPDTILALGGGRPKYLGKKFPFEGASIGLKHKGIQYAFRPNDLDKVKTDVSFGKWKITGVNAHNKIEIEAIAPKEKFMDLEFMTPQGDIFHDLETLTGHVTVRLYRPYGLGWKLIESLQSDFAGIEYGAPFK